MSSVFTSEEKENILKEKSFVHLKDSAPKYEQRKEYEIPVEHKIKKFQPHRTDLGLLESLPSPLQLVLGSVL